MDWLAFRLAFDLRPLPCGLVIMCDREAVMIANDGVGFVVSQRCGRDMEYAEILDRARECVAEIGRWN
jgi:hypothetical protein